MKFLNEDIVAAPLAAAFREALAECESRRHEFLTPEHLLLAVMNQNRFQDIPFDFLPAGLLDTIEKRLIGYLNMLESVPESVESYRPIPSEALNDLERSLQQMYESSSAEKVSVPHALFVLSSMDFCYAGELVRALFSDYRGDIMNILSEAYYTDNLMNDLAEGNVAGPFTDADFIGDSRASSKPDWRTLVVCVNDTLESRNPLIGREAELERTVQVLCRKDKNNPLHVGEPGVGKTALVYGLARMIEEGRVPERLRGRKIYRLDVGSLLAGTKYRGDFEERLKNVMEGLKSESGAIVYIDEIHTIVGAGAGSNEGVDAANQLKPYLESGDIRFIGSTTYEEYNRQFSKSKSLVRRFQQIDINEPSVEEAIEILSRLKPIYEEFHNVRYTDAAIEYAVRATARHIADRRLPDKAIDLVDEAGAFRELNPSEDDGNVVDEELMARTLARICRIETAVVADTDEAEQLRTLTDRVLARVYGQDVAVRAVTEAVMMSKAGLTDPEKPIASMLFVGPTGVGKTEVALALAEAMGTELVRFDMSEYTEKHAVAKLIGAPAGYVGYEEGGLLTDAVRKSPNCVLLLDEIEKAHSDIYNILLQVMDYGRLTDNKGNKADFRNVVLIMTSNAGAQHAAQASVGFGSNVTAADAMVREVKRLFKPEFINRLSAMVTFNSLDRDMGGRILDKKVRQLETMLAARKVTLDLAPAARALLLEEGVTRDHGARELDRVIASRLKPMLMREILFGALRDGGIAHVGLAPDGSLSLESASDPQPTDTDPQPDQDHR